MFGIGFLELAVIFVVLILFVGPEKMPKLAKDLAHYLRQFRGVRDDIHRTVYSVMDDDTTPRPAPKSTMAQLPKTVPAQAEKKPEPEVNKDHG